MACCGLGGTLDINKEGHDKDNSFKSILFEYIFLQIFSDGNDGNQAFRESVFALLKMN